MDIFDTSRFLQENLFTVQLMFFFSCNGHISNPLIRQNEKKDDDFDHLRKKMPANVLKLCYSQKLIPLKSPKFDDPRKFVSAKSPKNSTMKVFSREN